MNRPVSARGGGAEREDTDSKYQIDYLVFSSHKTATQSLVASLNGSGLRSMHCHVPENIGLQPGEFVGYLEEYARLRGRRLKILSTFREPIERFVSSFFQWHGIRAVRSSAGIDERASIIFRLGFEELQEEFYNFCRACNAIDGAGESLFRIGKEVQVSCEDFRFSEADHYGQCSFEFCDLYLFRFDLLVQNFSPLLERVVNCPIVQCNSNLADEKWYASRYRDFRDRLVIPSALVEDIYAARWELISLFYPGYPEQMVASARHKYDPEIPAPR